MQALLPVAVIVALILSVRRRDMAYLPPLLLYGFGIAFVAVSYVGGSTIGNLRYYVLEIPLVFVSLAMIPSVDPARPHLAGFTELPSSQDRRPPVVVRIAGGLLAVVVVLGSTPLMVHAVQDPAADQSDYGIRSVLHPARYPIADQNQNEMLPYGRQMSSYISSLHLPEGSVLLDTWEGFSVVITTTETKTYVISSDIDFTAALNDPVRFGVKYFLVPSPRGIGALDAINRRYPRFWHSGAGFARLVITFRSVLKTLPAWRLYRIDPPTSASKALGRP